MSGVITGGWGFVIAAYAVTAAGLLIYGISLAARLRGDKTP
ncbi:MAG TPA: hypothetical protein VKB93_07850 [Thermoanaerobaculia bacterium]|nr:hypothetical protein [Thermoanaerobaculia bacterium]